MPEKEETMMRYLHFDDRWRWQSVICLHIPSHDNYKIDFKEQLP